MEQARATDPTKQELREVISHWRDTIGRERITVRRLVERASRQNTSFGGRLEFDQPDLREALLAVAGQGGAINGRRLGIWLATRAKQVVDDRWIEQAGLFEGSMTWQLIDQGKKEAAQEPGSAAAPTPEDLGF